MSFPLPSRFQTRARYLLRLQSHFRPQFIQLARLNLLRKITKHVALLRCWMRIAVLWNGNPLRVRLHIEIAAINREYIFVNIQFSSLPANAAQNPALQHIHRFRSHSPIPGSPF